MFLLIFRIEIKRSNNCQRNRAFCFSETRLKFYDIHSRSKVLGQFYSVYLSCIITVYTYFTIQRNKLICYIEPLVYEVHCFMLIVFNCIVCIAFITNTTIHTLRIIYTFTFCLYYVIVRNFNIVL